MTFDDITRTVNLALCTTVLLMLAYRRSRYPYRYPRGGLRRDIWAMTFLWALAMFVGTIEMLFEFDTAFRVYLIAAALLTSLSILLRPERNDQDWDNTSY